MASVPPHQFHKIKRSSATRTTCHLSGSQRACSAKNTRAWIARISASGKRSTSRPLKCLTIRCSVQSAQLIKSHKQAIQEEVTHGLDWMRRSKTKDELHGALIVTLFKMVFLLLGRLPYRAKGKRRSLATFRTLTYSQTEEQLSWLLQGYVQRHASEHGSDTFFDADYAFLTWTREKQASAFGSISIR